MAYQVKYRLQFSDLQNNPRKVEIWQNNYSGDVLPMIGTDSPVTIEYQSDNDFFKPIQGSKCNLNLMVTDDVDYDEFFRFDEQEFLIKVYAGLTRAKSVYNRATSHRYIDNYCALDEFSYVYPNISDNLINRVANDGGIVEAPNCIMGGITDSLDCEWDLYWQGFLVADTYKEALTQKPYPISLSALDGLGTLKLNQSQITGVEYPSSISSARTFVDYTLQLINLSNITELYTKVNFWASKQYQNSSSFDEFKDENICGDSVFKSGFKMKNIKEMLSDLLNYTNSRMYQYGGQLYIEPVSVDNTIVTNLPSNQTQETAEYIKSIVNGIMVNPYTGMQFYTRYFQQGSQNSQPDRYEGFPAIKRVNNELIAMNNDIQIEYLPPYQQVKIDADLSAVARRTVSMTQNPTMEYSTGITVISGQAVLGTHPIANSGTRSIKITNFISTGTPTNTAFRMLPISLATGSDRKFIETKPNFDFSLEYYVQTDGTATPKATLYYSVNFYRANSFGTTNNLNWFTFSEEDNTWIQANNSSFGNMVKNEIRVIEEDNMNLWNSVSSLPGLPDGQGASTGVMQVTVWQPKVYENASAVEAIYFDNITTSFQKDTKKKIEATLTNSNTTNSAIYETKIPAIKATILNELRSDFLVSSTGSVTGGLVKKANAVLKLYQDYVYRYEMTLKNMTNYPICINSKPYMNFDTYKDDAQQQIDRLTYYVKQNEYKAVTHKASAKGDPTITATFDFR
tara:strand:- start:893 stop:3106 length:2214 start_codon:yes stop_codon:yes gene_type:complete